MNSITIWLLASIYAAGYITTAFLAARDWFKQFGVEMSGAVWACVLIAPGWPLLLPILALKWAASRGL